MSGLICAGNVYLDRYVNGVKTGEYGPLNATSFAIAAGSSKTIERKSYMRDSYGSTLDSVILPENSGKMSIEIDDADPETLALMLLGTLTDEDAISGSVLVGAPEAVVAHKGYWTKLAHRDVSSVVLKDVTDATTYVAGVDYTLDATAGMVKILSGSTIVDGATLHASYSYGSLDSKKILANQSTEIRCAVRLDGKNLANQKKIEVTVPEVPLVPSGDLSLSGDAFVKFKLEGTIVLRAGESAPFYYREIA